MQCPGCFGNRIVAKESQDDNILQILGKLVKSFFQRRESNPSLFIAPSPPLFIRRLKRTVLFTLGIIFCKGDGVEKTAGVCFQPDTQWELLFLKENRTTVGTVALLLAKCVS